MGLLDHVRQPKLVAFPVEVGDIRFTVRAVEELKDEARTSALRHWEQIEAYVVQHSAFKTSFVPIPVAADAPQVVRAMADASELTHAGPMVGLPGALAEAIARDLAMTSREVVVSGEGDVFMIGRRTFTFMVDPPRGDSTGIAVKVRCDGSRAFYTSTGRVTFQPAIGIARAVSVIADKGALTGSAASAIAYAMHRPQDVERALDLARKIPGVQGALVIVDDAMGMWGDLEIVSGVHA